MAFVNEDGENWQACLEWIFRCDVLNGNAINDVQQLAQCLRDGVLLCNIINKLRPDTISSRDYSTKPQSSRVGFYSIMYFAV